MDQEVEDEDEEIAVENSQQETQETQETLQKRAQIRARLSALGVSEERLKLWDEVCVKSAPKLIDGKLIRVTPEGILRKYEEYIGDLTPENLKLWESLPKKGPEALGSLQKIKHPILCGWTLEEIIEASTPYLGKIVTEYKTERSPREDCEQQGKLGIILAVGTDAGIAPFADHAFRHIKTNVRRYAATAGVVKRTEKTPTKTEVKTKITAWLGAQLYQLELDRLASLEKNLVAKKVLGKDKAPRFETFTELQFTLDQAQLLKEGTISLEQRADLDEEITKLKELVESIPDTATENLRKLREITHLNDTNLLRPEDLTISKIQKIGHLRSCNCNACNVPLICESFPLERLTATQQMDLFDYLNKEFNPLFRHDATEDTDSDVRGWSYRMRDKDGVPIKDEAGQPVIKHTRSFRTSQHILSQLDQTRFQTIGDLIIHVAHAPDFHSEPSPWSVPMEDGSSKNDSVGNKWQLRCNEVRQEQGEASTSPFLNPRVIVEGREQEDEVRELMERVRSRIPLTHEQEVVMIETWGLDGVEPRTGSFIADHFGKLVLMHSIRKQFASQDTNRKLSELGEGLLTLATNLGSYVVSEESLQKLIDLKVTGLALTSIGITKLLEECEEWQSKRENGERKSDIEKKQHEEEAKQQLLIWFLAKIERSFKGVVFDRSEVEGGVSRQRITQYQDAIRHKFRNALFDLHFNRDTINRVRQYVKLSDLEEQVINLLYGLDGGKVLTFDQVVTEEVIKQLDVAPSVLKLKAPHRREYMRDLVQRMKLKLLNYYY